MGLWIVATRKARALVMLPIPAQFEPEGRFGGSKAIGRLRRALESHRRPCSLVDIVILLEESG